MLVGGIKKASLKVIRKWNRGQEALHSSFSTSAVDLNKFKCRTTCTASVSLVFSLSIFLVYPCPYLLTDILRIWGCWSCFSQVYYLETKIK